uniref:5'-nucleotidase, cytosolic IAb n=1 Tax=Anabas testudineus TaxID=64144 RepID=A0AAQ6IKQ1_ANATE
MSDPETPVTVAITSELLFDLQSREPGPVFSFVKALEAANAQIKEHFPETKELFRVILINDNSSDKSLKETLKKTQLDKLIVWPPVSGENLIAKLKENKTHLYLSAKTGFKIHEAVNAGIAAASVFNSTLQQSETPNLPLCVVFDGDAVLFSDESECVTETGLENFFKHEDENVDIPMTEGPLKVFLEALKRLQRKFYDNNKREHCPILTYLLTSRNAGNAGYRALNTLKTWGLGTDQAYFLNGTSKGPLIKMINPHIFFDDQREHLEAAMEEGKLACLVPRPEKNP